MVSKWGDFWISLPSTVWLTAFGRTSPSVGGRVQLKAFTHAVLLGKPTRSQKRSTKEPTQLRGCVLVSQNGGFVTASSKQEESQEDIKGRDRKQHLVPSP